MENKIIITDIFEDKFHTYYWISEIHFLIVRFGIFWLWPSSIGQMCLSCLSIPFCSWLGDVNLLEVQSQWSPPPLLGRSYSATQCAGRSWPWGDFWVKAEAAPHSPGTCHSPAISNQEIPPLPPKWLSWTTQKPGRTWLWIYCSLTCLVPSLLSLVPPSSLGPLPSWGSWASPLPGPASLCLPICEGDQQGPGWGWGWAKEELWGVGSPGFPAPQHPGPVQ